MPPPADYSIVWLVPLPTPPKALPGYGCSTGCCPISSSLATDGARRFKLLSFADPRGSSPISCSCSACAFWLACANAYCLSLSSSSLIILSIVSRLSLALSTVTHFCTQISPRFKSSTLGCKTHLFSHFLGFDAAGFYFGFSILIVVAPAAADCLSSLSPLSPLLRLSS